MAELITMSQKELSRYEIIKRLIRKEINGTEAAKQMDLSVRQTKRLKARVIKKGEKGIIHKSRGRVGNRRVNPEIIEKAKFYLQKRYSDFQPTFAMEKLEENHKIKLSKEKVRQIMMDLGLWQPRLRKKNKEYRSWRQRKDNYGEMEQFDGCYFDWFETGQLSCLLASRDDATNKITGLMFVADEGVKSVASFWKEYFETQGKPLKIYLDRLSTYKNTQRSVADDPQVLTQFQRMMQQSGVELIFAYSPQAKGRIETLFPTLQHRLVREMRLAGIKTPQEANRFVKEVFIPKFNTQFSVIPAKRGNLHQKLSRIEVKQLEKVFSRQEVRYVNNDFTIRYQGNWFQLLDKQPVLVRKKEKVMVEERVTGEVFLSLRGKYLNYTVLPERPKKIIEAKIPALAGTKSSWKPPANHPWRRFNINPENKEKVSSLP
ncbi:MAG TPA: ISNCY family transposase [Candidatus Pacearchaeota archaeon]|nr:ISNCY family transposase [Candidatus Pacearchaeota archaeon]